MSTVKSNLETAARLFRQAAELFAACIDTDSTAQLDKAGRLLTQAADHIERAIAEYISTDTSP